MLTSQLIYSISPGSMCLFCLSVIGFSLDKAIFDVVPGTDTFNKLDMRFTLSALNKI